MGFLYFSSIRGIFLLCVRSVVLIKFIRKITFGTMVLIIIAGDDPIYLCAHSALGEARDERCLLRVKVHHLFFATEGGFALFCS